MYDELAGRLYVAVLVFVDDVLAGLTVDLVVVDPVDTADPVPRLLLAAVDVTDCPDVTVPLPLLNTGVAEPEPERVAIALEELRRTLDDAVLTFPVAVRLPTLLVREKPGLLCRPTVEAREP